jgi:ElaB/YqjD/DUF883 family membrane-anchored ribosome-binding protein
MKMATETSQTPPATSTAPATNVVALPAKTPEQRPSDKAIAWVKKHPVLTIAGGIAVGAAVGALLPRRAGQRMANRAFELAEMAAATSMMFGREAADKAEEIGEGAKRKAGSLAHTAERLGDRAAHRVERAGSAALGTAGALAYSARNRAERLGDAAVDRASRVSQAALDTSTRLIGYPKPPLSLTDRILVKAGEIKGRIRS